MCIRDRLHAKENEAECFHYLFFRNCQNIFSKFLKYGKSQDTGNLDSEPVCNRRWWRNMHTLTFQKRLSSVICYFGFNWKTADGLKAFAAVATPANRPPPLQGASSESSSGTSSRNSTAAVA